MTTTNDDWESLCAIYKDYDSDSDGCRQKVHHDERRVKLLVSTSFRGGFCGTVFITLSSNKVAFGRLVNNDGYFRYFKIAKPPIIRCDFLYFSPSKGGKDIISTWKEQITSNDEDTNKRDYWSEESTIIDDNDNDGPSNLRLLWEYYPQEWPIWDKEKYQSSLAKKCNAILRENQMSFSVIEFLENNAMSFYYKANDTTNSACRNNYNDIDSYTDLTNTRNTYDNWKTYFDLNYPEYLLVLLPPEFDRTHYKTKGIMIHPQEEAKVLAKHKANGMRKYTTFTAINSTLEFGRYALIQNWKDLYKAQCPICLDDSLSYDDGIILPFCQHYCCRNCFDLYLKYKVNDLDQHRTNPFVCPVESCKRELPILSYCKQFLSEDDMDKVKAWYRDLRNPPAWILDRCVSTKSCGALGSMRRRKSILGSGKGKSSSLLSSNLNNLIYCEECNKTWCELCLCRVYNDDVTYDIKLKDKTEKQIQETIDQNRVSNHVFYCKPQQIQRFCHQYMVAPKHQKDACEAKFPWIVSYTQFFYQHDGAAVQYIKANGQRCPSCKMGVERSGGCFHMKCSNCAAHFCYECGKELFPPYYGTHHCWEERDEDDHNNNNENNRVNIDEEW